MASTDETSEGARRLPLSGLRVLDLTLARAGPTCVRHLGDWGADVIRIEPAQASDEELSGKRDDPDFQNLHRNKRAMCLNLKSAPGHEIFMRLIKEADVVVENMRPEVKYRLGISWDEVRATNPRLVYASISGFGQDGPYHDRAGVDQIAQGMGGLMSITGLAGQGPVRAGIPITDLTAGNLLALGVMIALFERERTGTGRWVHTSLLESQIFMLDFQAARWLMQGEVAGQAGNDHPTLTPMGMFPATDGHINIAASSGRLWERFCEAIGRPDWKSKEEWKTNGARNRQRQAINAAISEITQHKPAAYWIEVFEKAGVPCGPIYSIDQVFGDPQVQHLGMAAPITHPRLGQTHIVHSGINLTGVPKEIRTPTPDAGTHTQEILEWLGYREEEIEEMRKKGVVA